MNLNIKKDRFHVNCISRKSCLVLFIFLNLIFISIKAKANPEIASPHDYITKLFDQIRFGDKKEFKNIAPPMLVFKNDALKKSGRGIEEEKTNYVIFESTSGSVNTLEIILKKFEQQEEQKEPKQIMGSLPITTDDDLFSLDYMQIESSYWKKGYGPFGHTTFTLKSVIPAKPPRPAMTIIWAHASYGYKLSLFTETLDFKSSKDKTIVDQNFRVQDWNRKKEKKITYKSLANFFSHLKESPYSHTSHDKKPYHLFYHNCADATDDLMSFALNVQEISKRSKFLPTLPSGVNRKYKKLLRRLNHDSQKPSFRKRLRIFRRKEPSSRAIVSPAF